MTAVRLPAIIPPLDHLHPDVPSTVFDEAFRKVTQRLDAYIAAVAAETAIRLDLHSGLTRSAEHLLADRGWAPSGRWPLSWLLETLQLFGMAERRGSDWQLAVSTPPVAADVLHERALDASPACRPAYEMMGIATAALPAVLAGEVRGEDVLFGPATMALWFDYVANSNPHYAPNNALAAVALASRVAPGARILEVGGGGGGAAEMILGTLAAAGTTPAEYVFSDVHPAFLRRGSRVVQQILPPGCALRSLRVDINTDLVAQGLEAGAFDAVVAVNTLHLGAGVVATLDRLRRVLRPGGVIAIGESIRPTPDAGMHLELPFALLGAYCDVPLEEGIRVRPGFVAAEGWTTGLRRAGFSDIRILPARLRECLELYPGFYCGAITAVV